MSGTYCDCGRYIPTGGVSCTVCLYDRLEARHNSTQPPRPYWLYGLAWRIKNTIKELV